MKKISKRLKKILTPWNLLIFSILLVAFFIRVYRTGDLLGFYYDQGRDAKVIWDLWHAGKTFLIGPVTGLPGIFLGPLYYYLIAPFYLIGAGNPVYPSVFLSFLVTVSLFVLYKAGEEIGGKETGLITLLIGSFSNYLVFSSRWLSNPTPVYLSSILLFYSFIKIVKSKKTTSWWYVSFLMAGVSFQFESASAAFYMPVFFTFLVWQRSKIDRKRFLISSGLFLSTFLPQLIFNFRHGNILLNNIKEEVLKKDLGDEGIVVSIPERLKLFWKVYAEKIFPGKDFLVFLFSLFSLYGLSKYVKGKKSVDVLKLFSIFIFIPAFFYTIYRGNHGVLYDYYFTGYYYVLVLLFSWGISWFWQKKSGKLLLSAFVILFLFINISTVLTRLRLDVLNSQEIFLSNELMAIDWIYNDAKDRGDFNVDVYVPPVIPHSYDYLFLWQGNIKENGPKLVTKENVDLLYTIYEIDPPHPGRLEAWLRRQEIIGMIEEEATFGGITVQRRERISDR